MLSRYWLAILLFLSGTASAWAQDQQPVPGDRVYWHMGKGEERPVPDQVLPTSSDSILFVRQLKQGTLKWFVSRGYFDVQIDSVRYRRDRMVAYGLKGVRYALGRVEIDQPDSLLPAGNIELPGEGTPYTDNRVEGFVNGILEQYEELGYGLARVDISGIMPDPVTKEVTVRFRVRPGRRLRVEGMLFPELERTDPAYLERVTGIPDSAVVTPSLLETARQNLLQTELFRNVGEPEIVVKGDSTLLQFNLRERNPNQFDLLVGYVPEPGGGGSVVGNGRIRVRNLFWDGSDLRLSFERMQRLVTRLEAGFRRDWIFGAPLGLGGSFHFLQQDTSYQVRNIKGEASYTLGGSMQLRGSLRREATAAADEPGLRVDVLDATATFAGLGFRYRRLDNYITPRRGLELNVELETGIKAVTDARADADSVDSRLHQRIVRFSLRPYLPTFKRQVMAFSLHGYFIDSPQFSESDLVRFGGARSLRGYREDQFRASRMLWGDVEYRYLLDPTSYAFIFGALGTYHRPHLVTEPLSVSAATRWLHSYGLGFTYATRLGLLQFTYAISPEDRFTNGKVHFGIVADL